MARSYWLALLLLLPATPALAQPDSVAVSTTDAPAPLLAPIAPAPTTQAIEDARAILVALRVDEVISRMAETVGPQASASLLAEVRLLPDGEAMLAAWDREYPGGRLGVAERYRDVLINKFREGRLLFVDHMAIELARRDRADDLRLTRLTLLDEIGALKTGEALAAARAILADAGVSQRMAANQAQVTAEMARFGRELGEGFGVQAFQQVVDEAQARRVQAPTAP